MLNPAGEFTAPPGPLAGLGARERKGGVREEGRGGDEREKEEGEEREGDAVSQHQFLDQPVITMGLSCTVSEKKTSISVKKNRIFYIPGSLTPPPKGVSFGIL